MNQQEIQTQLTQIEQNIANIKAMSGFSAEQLQTMLAPLQQKKTELQAQLLPAPKSVGQRGIATNGDISGDVITGDNNHIQHIINIYQDGGGTISPQRLQHALTSYTDWVMTHYGRLPLRGLSDREYYLPDPDLPDIYVSLAAQKEAEHGWQEKEQETEPIDMSNLLSQGPRLVITGGPGSGKTTFLRHIAYLLAHAIRTGDDRAIRKTLNLQGDIPLPIYLSLADFHRYRQTENGTLIDFISHTLIQQHGVYGLPNDFFAQMLSQDNTICLLLDSLDEIPDDDGRFQVSNAVLQLADHHSIGQILVASRDHAYVGRTMLPKPFKRFIVQPMVTAQIEALVNRWCQAVYQPRQANDEAHSLLKEIQTLETIRKNQGELPLVDTPLMVTIVAIVHYNERKLPQQRAALYEKCVTALLAEQHKGEEGEGSSLNALEKRGGSTDTKRGYLALLAYEMMCSGSDQPGGRTVSQAQMETWLLPAFQQNEGEENAPQKLHNFQRAMNDRASILHERAGEIEFTHLTFQEFLCAYYLATNLSPMEIAEFYKGEDRVSLSWWQETILLTIGYLAKTANTQALKLVQALLNTFPNDVNGFAAVELAAEGLLEMEILAPEIRRNTRSRLVFFLNDNNQLGSIPFRASAGRTLNALGDNRPGVGVVKRNGLNIPDIAWGNEVPVGTYSYQNGTTIITKPYRLAKHPITNEQFQCFVDAFDRDDSRWWRGMPTFRRDFREGQLPFANHPREQITWYQAVAFCRWISDKLGYGVDLPLEQEWEVAARYPDGRAYPWGNEFDLDKANINDHSRGMISSTTAVSIYPSGKNEILDLYDMIGNVNEWCRNKYDRPEQDQVDLSGDVRVIRGGSWRGPQHNTMAVFRYYDPPGDYNNAIGFRVVMRRFLSSPKSES